MNILPAQTNTHGKQYSTFEFDTNEKAMDFIKKTDKILERCSCFESSGKYYVCYYLDDSKLHGGVIECIQEAFHDVTIYADGYTERYYIGD